MSNQIKETLLIDGEAKGAIDALNEVSKALNKVFNSRGASQMLEPYDALIKKFSEIRAAAADEINLTGLKSIKKETKSATVSLNGMLQSVEQVEQATKKQKISLMSAGAKEAGDAYGLFVKKQKEFLKSNKEAAALNKMLNAAIRKQMAEEHELSELQERSGSAEVKNKKAEIELINKQIEAIKKYQRVNAEDSTATPAQRGGATRTINNVLPNFDPGTADDKIEELTTKAEKLNEELAELESRKFERLKQLPTIIANSKKEVASLQDALDTKTLDNNKKIYNELRQILSGISGIDISNISEAYTPENAALIRNVIDAFESKKVEEFDAALKKAKEQLIIAKGAAKDAGEKIDGVGESLERSTKASQDFESMKNRIAQFIGLAGAANLARQAIRNAFQTITELDAAMTEMAVVTNLSVGDYWEQLPEHTENARELGVAIKDVYTAEMLYYQQGLKTAQVTGMATETLKMAKVAGLDAKDATDKMTAALRGFNMELNETSAQRIADVYSELAAITASDVNEISTAMTKTASIAASAGMEFETTAAFLSQIIETTRESAETAGTAMKTVIARFQELKKDPAEIGEVDGEIIDANKIETALRSVGVALRDSSGQFRDLDDVFLELASKWDGLDTNTQRYIATIAAGSRQQSRFIAMMSDYGRTQELVTAANNSAGASNAQFEKTAESLEFKINQLKDTWQEFTMGLMNSDIVKAGVDILTTLVAILNRVTEGFGDFSSSFSKISLIVTLFQAAKSLFNRLTEWVKDKFYSAGAEAGKGFAASMKKGMADGGANIDDPSGSKKKPKNKKQRTARINESKEKEARLKANAETFGAAATAYRQDEQKYRDAANNSATPKSKNKNLELADAAASNAVKNEADAICAQEEYNKQIAETKRLQEEMPTAFEKTTQAIDGFGMGLSIAGVACAGLGTALESIGLKGAEEALGNVGNVLIMVGGGLSLVATIFPIVQAVGSAAGVGVTMSWGVFAAIALAIIAVITAIIIAFSYLASQTPEAKLKKAEEAAEKAGQAADAAADAYKNLSDSFDSLEDKYAALEGLTKGTREWRDAVKEINSEVMDLVEQYPELAQFVENKDGVMSIDLESEGVQGVLDQYESRAVQLAGSEFAAQMKVVDAQKAVERSNLSTKAQVGDQGAALKSAAKGAVLTTAASAVATMISPVLGVAVAGMGAEMIAAEQKQIAEQEELNQKQTEAIAKAMAEGWIVQTAEDKDENGAGDWIVSEGSEDKFAEFEDLGLDANTVLELSNSMGEAAEELSDYGKNVKALDEKQEALMQAMATNAMQLIDSTKFNEEQNSWIANYANADYADKIYQEQLDSIRSLSSSEYKKEAEKKAKELYGETAEIDDKGNITYKEGDKTIEVDTEEFEQAWAGADSTEEIAKRLENLPGAIEKAAQKFDELGTGDIYRKIAADSEGKNLTQEDIARMNEMTNDELAEVYNALSPEDLEALGVKDFLEFMEKIRETVDLGEKAFETAAKGLTSMGAETTVHSGISSKAAAGYIEDLEAVFSAFGQEGVDTLTNSLNTVLDGMSQSDYETFMEQFNAIDKTNLEALENFPETLKELGIAVSKTDLEKLIEDTKKYGQAILKIDLEKLNAQAQSLNKILSNLNSGTQDRTFSEQDYKTLIEASPELEKYFQLDLEGNYIYIGGAMKDLEDAVRDNTEALLGETLKILQDRVSAGNVLQGMADEGDDITKWRQLGNRDLQGYAGAFLTDFVTNAKNAGFDLTSLDIPGLGEDFDAEKYSNDKEALYEIMEKLKTIYTQLDENKEKITEKTIEASTLNALNNDAAYNSTQAGEYRNRLTNGEQLSETEWNAFQGQERALAVQATNAGVSAELIKDYNAARDAAKALEEKLQETGKLTITEQENLAALNMEIKDIGKQLVYGINFSKMTKQFEATTGELEEIVGQLEEVTDQNDKLAILEKAAGKFGLTVKEIGAYIGKEGEEAIVGTEELLNEMMAGGEEGFRAMERLAAAAADNMGIEANEMATINGYVWDGTLGESADKFKQFADLMVKLGLGMWQDIGDGNQMFSMFNYDQYSSKIALDSSDTGGEEIEMWESSYTYLYNYNEEINRLIKEREKAEKRYNRAIQSSTASAQDLLQTQKDELAALSAQVDVYTVGATKAYESIQKLFDENSEFAKYVSFNANSGQILIDDNGLRGANWTAEKGGQFENFLSKLEENRDAAIEATEALDDIEEQIEEIKDRGRDETIELKDTIKEGLIKERQEIIDRLTEVDEILKEAQDKLISKIQEQIDNQRQARENEKSEGAINDNQARLAYLQRDSSGANAVEILALQKQIEEEQLSYSDQLIDQKLQKLADDNTRAAEQRERQIELLQNQLTAYETGKQIWTDVQSILDASFKQAASYQSFAEGWKSTSAAYYQKLAGEFDSLNPEAQEKAAEDFSAVATKAYVYTTMDSSTFTGISDAIVGTENAKSTLYDVTNTMGTIGGYLSGGEDTVYARLGTIKNGIPNSKISTGTDVSGAASTVSAALGVAKAEVKSQFGDVNARVDGYHNDEDDGNSNNPPPMIPTPTIKDVEFRPVYFGQGEDGGLVATSALDAYKANQSGGDSEGNKIVFTDLALEGGWNSVFNLDIKGVSKKYKDDNDDVVIEVDGKEYKLLLEERFSGITAENFESAPYYYGQQYDIIFTDFSSGVKKIQSENVYTSYGDSGESFVASREHRDFYGKEVLGIESYTDGGVYLRGGHIYYYSDQNGLLEFSATSADSEDALISKALDTGMEAYEKNLVETGRSIPWKSDSGEVDEEIKDVYRFAYAAEMGHATLPNNFNLMTLDEQKKWVAEYKKKNPARFATGGLADFTGPAWLDGTKSSPELVLNAQDTRNFIALKDILSEVMQNHSPSGTTQGAAGDNYFEIEINVDNISDDYDVEQMAEKIRTMLYDDASYRNVNTINLIR